MKQDTLHKESKEKRSPFREKLHEIIFEADTPEGKLFDVILLIAILLSVFSVILETVPGLGDKYAELFSTLELIFTLLFSAEYILRIYLVGKPWKYIFSFMGIIDLVSVIPFYFNLLFTGPHYLLIIRAVRLLRIFRVLKLTRFLSEAQVLNRALRQSAVKITVFIGGVIVLVMILGSIMYIVEGPENGFTSIPYSMYWTIVTITTVGYGDIAPATAIGQTIASAVMLIGYGIIAVPTGIVTAELAKSVVPKGISTQACKQCSKEGHDPDAKNCKYCGAVL